MHAGLAYLLFIFLVRPSVICSYCVCLLSFCAVSNPKPNFNCIEFLLIIFSINYYCIFSVYIKPTLTDSYVHTVKLLACSFFFFLAFLIHYTVFTWSDMLLDAVLYSCMWNIQPNLFISYLFTVTRCLSSTQTLTELFTVKRLNAFCILSNIYVNSYPVPSWHLCTWMIERLLGRFCSILFPGSVGMFAQEMTNLSPFTQHHDCNLWLK